MCDWYDSVMAAGILLQSNDVDDHAGSIVGPLLKRSEIKITKCIRFALQSAIRKHTQTDTSTRTHKHKHTSTHISTYKHIQANISMSEVISYLQRGYEIGCGKIQIHLAKRRGEK